MHQLRALGISAEAEAIYLDLMARGALSIDEVAEGAPGSVDGPLDELAAVALIERSDGKVLPQPPHLAMEALAQRHTKEADLARESAALLSELWTAGIGQQTYVELLPSAEAAWSVLGNVQVDARERVRAMTVGNQASPQHRIVDGLFDALARGVTYEVIYGTQVLQDSEALRKVQLCVDAGEQARVFPQVPLNLTLVDDRWALVSARTTVGGITSTAAMVVHHSPFLTGLVGVFDAFWRMAVPITSGTEPSDVTGAPSLETKRLLTYLSAGLTDESIAREFGVSERTIARRISRLQETLGAQTRFQLGVQASRQQWL
ncbi:LuxR C-terminal-related transcriptional regulator [Kribbella sp. VKM Ac-2568]|uniref:LuxR C-terminal-related transcriptional regulator n=1 Tax=Kribbella sp. VKM Ac-2568 TaxID=2512219 RepID=UPI001046E4A1|nr:LuxR C-terminal-related transcriptional regulator [Kribbella sp. VKM Ac-2568]TCM44468.1 regulatory LuxR family protein [Kribbella sp. VKM Ac-2568]